MPRLGQSFSVRKSVGEALRASRANDNTPPHLIVRARAGTGKTTTMVEGLKILKGEPSAFTPSPQQALIWDSLKLSSKAQSICAVAFNAAIAEELRRRVPQGVDALTMHSLGGRAVRAQYRRVMTDDKGARVDDFTCQVLGRDFWDIRKTDPTIFGVMRQLIGLCKMNLVDGSNQEDVERIVSHYSIDVEEVKSPIYTMVPQILDLCKQVDRDGRMDFNDMIWLPVVLRLPMTKYDLLIVDEAQDLNRAQQELAKMAGRRLVFVGDDKQAIYGFAGADSESLPRLARELVQASLRYVPDSYEFCQAAINAGYGSDNPPPAEWNIIKTPGCIVLPLTVTRRCGKAIVEEAKKLVPDFEAHESNGPGKVAELSFDGGKLDYRAVVQSGDAVLCRVTAPLVQECLKFLKAGRKANIQGRDVGQGLVSTIKRVMTGWHCEGLNLTPAQEQIKQMVDLEERLRAWRDTELQKEIAKKQPSDSRMIALCDRYDCIMAFATECKSYHEVIEKITSLFTDDRHGVGVKFSTAHKAKGLEWNRVFLLMPEGATIPHPMAKTAWQKGQEYNLLYVMITRAISELYYVRGGKVLPKKSATTPGKLFEIPEEPVKPAKKSKAKKATVKKPVAKKRSKK